MPNPELSAGDLDKRVTLEMPILNEEQDEITGWAGVATVWAAIAPAAGAEQDASGRVVALLQTVITIRMQGAIDSRWRVRETYTGVIYEILAITNTQRRNAGLVLTCRRVE